MRANVIVLDRVVPDFIPEYSVYGTSFCCKCEEMVYVGHETARVLADEKREVWPICLGCAREHIPADTQPCENVEDGPCPNCGGRHLP